MTVRAARRSGTSCLQGKNTSVLESYVQITVLVTRQARKTQIRLFFAWVRVRVRVWIRVVVFVFSAISDVRYPRTVYHYLGTPGYYFHKHNIEIRQKTGWRWAPPSKNSNVSRAAALIALK